MRFGNRQRLLDGLFLLLAALLSFSPASASDARIPAETYGRRFVEAVNSGDADTRLAGVREVFCRATLEERGEASLADGLARLGADYGHLEFHHAEVSEFRLGDSVRRSLHVFARSAKRDQWLDLQFHLEPDPPHRILQLVFIADVAEPVFLPPGGLNDPVTLDWLNDYVDRLAEDEDLSGAILVAAGDRPVFERYFGYADPERSVPCSAKTRFNLGSGNKMFTALGVALLVEDGLLELETPLEKFFPDLGDAAWRGEATVENLLSHTSGVAEYWTDETDLALTRTTTLGEIYPFVRQAGIEFEPGTQCTYSNSNFILAGLIIEQVSGGDYFDFIRSRIYAPAEMKDTDSYRTDGSVQNLAVPLTGEPRDWRLARRGRRGSSAGGGYSTARDILRFSRALVEGKIVPPAVLREMTRSHTEGIPEAQMDYGLGFIRERSADGVPSFGHGGIASGVNFEYRYFPRSDITLVAFSNQDNGAYDSLRKTVTKLITGER